MTLTLVYLSINNPAATFGPQGDPVNARYNPAMRSFNEDISGWDTSSVRNMNAMCKFCWDCIFYLFSYVNGLVYSTTVLFVNSNSPGLSLIQWGSVNVKHLLCDKYDVCFLHGLRV